MIALLLNEKAEAFRNEFRKWLASNPPPKLSERAPLDEFVEVSRNYQYKLSQARFVGVNFPEAFGGRGLTILEEAIVQEELAKARSPQLVGIFGLTMVGPVLVQHGTPEQQKRFLPKILSAEEIWCQGFSEPEAGSDLGSVKTKAEAVDGDPQANGWKITGQKIWTSFAQYARWCFLLARTSSQGPKHQGLSYFLLAMNAPGISVRPLPQITGEREFNEVFFDGAPVPPDQIVGREGEGWDIAISTLMHERVALTFARHLQSEQALTDIRELIASRGSVDDSVLKTFGAICAKNMAVRALALSHLSTYSNDNPPGPEGSMDKLFWSENFQEIARFGMSLLGAEVAVTGGDDAHAGGLFQHRYLYSRGRTIAAGTSEIQRNIIAQRVLGMPK